MTLVLLRTTLKDAQRWLLLNHAHKEMILVEWHATIGDGNSAYLEAMWDSLYLNKEAPVSFLWQMNSSSDDGIDTTQIRPYGVYYIKGI